MTYLTKHITSENHKKSIAAEKNQRITSFMVKRPEENDKLVYAETKFATFSICGEKQLVVLAFVMNFRRSSAT